MEGNVSQIDLVVELNTFRRKVSNKPRNYPQSRHLPKGRLNGRQKTREAKAVPWVRADTMPESNFERIIFSKR